MTMLITNLVTGRASTVQEGKLWQFWALSIGITCALFFHKAHNIDNSQVREGYPTYPLLTLRGPALPDPLVPTSLLLLAFFIKLIANDLCLRNCKCYK